MKDIKCRCMEQPQNEMELGYIQLSDGTIDISAHARIIDAAFRLQLDWGRVFQSQELEINYCPFCGRKLSKFELMGWIPIGAQTPEVGDLIAAINATKKDKNRISTAIGICDEEDIERLKARMTHWIPLPDIPKNPRTITFKNIRIDPEGSEGNSD